MGREGGEEGIKRKKGEKKEGSRAGNITKFEHNLLLPPPSSCLPVAQSALRQITDKAREFGADALFNQILPLLMSPTLEDQERHLLVKVIDRILYKLDDLVRPYVHKVSGRDIRCWGYSRKSLI